MKSAPFDYIRARDLGHALDLLATWGDGARVLAGGQSLLPTLALRLDRPQVLIDVQEVSELSRPPELRGDHWRLSALTPHVFFANSSWAREHLPLMADAAPHIAHHAIRHRGTLGGSLAMAHPASEWPACLLALGGQVLLQSAGRGLRHVPIDDFFVGICQTQKADDELLLGVEVPAQRPLRQAFREIARRPGDYAALGLAATAQGSSERGWDTRWVFFGVGDMPLRLKALEEVWRVPAQRPDLSARSLEVVGQHLNPRPDPGYGVETKNALARHMIQEVIDEWLV